MPTYGKTSDKRLNTCHKDLQVIFREVVATYDNSILCGHRHEPEQNKAFSDGLSQLQFPDSKHNSYPSMAVDAAPYFKELKNIDWKDALAFAYFAGYVKRVAEVLLKEGKISHRIRWGGDWDGDRRTTDQNFQDLPHFELIPA